MMTRITIIETALGKQDKDKLSLKITQSRILARSLLGEIKASNKITSRMLMLMLKVGRLTTIITNNKMKKLLKSLLKKVGEEMFKTKSSLELKQSLGSKPQNKENSKKKNKKRPSKKIKTNNMFKSPGETNSKKTVL